MLCSLGCCLCSGNKKPRDYNTAVWSVVHHVWERLYLSLRERRFMLKQLTWGKDLDLLIETNVAVNVSISFGPKDSVERESSETKLLNLVGLQSVEIAQKKVYRAESPVSGWWWWEGGVRYRWPTVAAPCLQGWWCGGCPECWRPLQLHLIRTVVFLRVIFF